MLKLGHCVLLVACLLQAVLVHGQPTKGLGPSFLGPKPGNFQQQLLQKSQSTGSRFNVLAGNNNQQVFQQQQQQQQQQPQAAILIAAAPERQALFPSKFQLPFSSFEAQGNSLQDAPARYPAPRPQALITQQKVELPQSYSTKSATKSAQPYRQQRVESVNAAIMTKRTHEVVDVKTDVEEVTPHVIIVEPNVQPVTIEFRSRSSPVNINQVHIPGEKGEERITRTEEPADRVIHEVLKPVVAEIRELIQPIRLISQKVLPVKEEFHSVVSRGQRKLVVKEPISQQAEQQQVQEQEPEPVVQQQQQQQVPQQLQLPQQPQPLPKPQPQPQPPVVQQQQQQEVQQELEQIKLKRAASEPEPTWAPHFPSFGNTGTIVRAGLIGGTRILPSVA